MKDAAVERRIADLEKDAAVRREIDRLYAEIERVAGERDAARELLKEWVAAHDAERAAARASAKAQHEAFKGYPDPPRRMPRNAVLASSLSPEEQRCADEDSARFMAPIDAAMALHAASRARVASAIAAARTSLSAREAAGRNAK